eukprot:TRINITY_DN296_c0_g1_i2.p1 TRINITY_DN296_c0_g1~~TRINITY_DN296_c0_g1_i2.p1  ORF type:complete len:426 (+),score=139.58 TRINITY_DN296_c0_g1_i2:225-1502(+)
MSTRGLRRGLSRTFEEVSGFFGIPNQRRDDYQEYLQEDNPPWMRDDFWEGSETQFANNTSQADVDVPILVSEEDDLSAASAPPLPTSPPAYKSPNAPRLLMRATSHQRLFDESDGSKDGAVSGFNNVPVTRQSFAGRGRGRGRGRLIGRPGLPGRKDQPAPHVMTEHTPYFIILVTIIDLCIVIFEIVENRGFESFSNNPWGGPNVQTLIDLGAKKAQLMLDGQWWRFFTPIFMHVGLIHFALNMFMQVRVGRELEKLYGANRIIPIYMLCGLFGNIVSAIFLPQQVQVGASGSLFGFEGVLLADLIQNWALLKNPIRSLISQIASMLLSFAFGFLLPGVDNFCHFGGLIMGIVTGFLFLPNLSSGKAAARKRLFVVCITIPIVLLLIVGGFIVFYTTNSSRWCTFCSEITCIKVLPWCKTGFKL